MRSDEMFVVWTDPLEAMEATPIYAHVPEWLTLAHQQRYDQAWVFHTIAKGEVIHALHVGHEDPERDDVPDWPDARRIEQAAEKEAEWTKIARIRAADGQGTSVPVSPARPGAGPQPGQEVRLRHVPKTSTYAGISVPCWTVGTEEILQCLHCSETWIREAVRGRKPMFCPDCR